MRILSQANSNISPRDRIPEAFLANEMMVEVEWRAGLVGIYLSYTECCLNSFITEELVNSLLYYCCFSVSHVHKSIIVLSKMYHITLNIAKAPSSMYVSQLSPPSLESYE